MATMTERRLERVRAHKDRWAAALWVIVRLVDDRALGEISAELRRAEIYLRDAARESALLRQAIAGCDSRTLRRMAGDHRLALAVVEREIRGREETAEIREEARALAALGAGVAVDPAQLCIPLPDHSGLASDRPVPAGTIGGW